MTQASKRYQIGKLYDLEITQVSPDPAQPRKYIDKQALEELKLSIEKHGVLQPVLVRRGEGGGFLLVSGERRYHASLAGGRATIPALLTNGDPAEISIVENLLREDLTAVEEAEAIERLKASHNYQLSDLCGILGKAESTLCEILSLNRLPAAVKDDCRSDPRVARSILAEIAKQSTSARMLALYDKYKSRGLTRGEIRTQKVTLKHEASQAEAAAADPLDVGLVKKFTKHLDGLEVEHLDKPQSRAVLTYLDVLRLAVNRKVKMLKARVQTP